MERSFLTMHYYETYYYANVVNNVIADPVLYLRGLNDWHEDREIDLFLMPFQKWSALHDLVGFILRDLINEENEYVARAVQILATDSVPEQFRKYLLRNGVLKRVPMPKWAQRAVFFCERGRRASCSVDLSGLLTAQTVGHYDHIVPLSEGGINDVTNLQLLCEACNLTKSKKRISASKRYESWY